ncbi:MAG: GNAT family N-acetyltransferase [Deltaproteobacteria bacterium]|nr:GNAT family N-acetyltransferase [Deltaproteobacteria bacterium]MBW1952439.1 GNAT family N-acetyltransferase [Deltaproteobacteria bacterium]MBW1986683.1 GNAT family N-acetyltransferase [Deltaproteobacteria bacterium]MBW2134890.1 GNAT family N-acetyltransferase [Deltaproteobacteria bacterium]
MELGDYNYTEEILEDELTSWVEAEFATLVLPAVLEPGKNRRRVNLTRDGQWLEIDICQEYLCPEPRWILRARMNILFDQQIAIITCLHVLQGLRAQGLGRQMLARLENLSRQLQITRILIDTPTQEGWKFFKHQGYREVKSKSVMVSHGQLYSVRLEKLLSE